VSFLRDLQTTGAKRKLTGTRARLVSIIAVLMSLYQVWQCVFSSMQPQLHYAIHITFVLVLLFLVYTPFSRSNRNDLTLMDIIFAILALVAGVYYITQVDRYVNRWPLVDQLTTMDIITAIIMTILVIEGTRRTMGTVLPMIAIIFLVYVVGGHLLPGFLRHRHVSFLDTLDQLVFTQNGIFSSPFVVASTFVFLFVMFGAFFANSGAGDFFYNFSMALAGRFSGGPAKVAIVASALFGTINGSPTANVATTGSFTIPMMKRIGYKPVYAGAVTAVAGTGGGILPPIMGTAAFLMVEMAGIPYGKIALAAALPGIIYYVALTFMVHLKAKKDGLSGIDSSELPSLSKTLREGVQFLLPLVVLVVMLGKGYTPSLTAVAGTASVVIVSWFRKDTRMGVRKILKSLESAAISSLIITLSCAIAGMVINGLMTTGLSGKLASLILRLGGKVPILALIITAVLCILLGMGMPVAAAYALTASLAIPSLYELGISPMAAHLFVVYYSTMSAITPPVAVASYAAAGICGADATKVGWSACRLGITSFIVPFMFVFNGDLLLSPENLGLSTLWVVGTSILGAYTLSASLEGWLLDELRPWQRLIMFVSGLMTIYPEMLTDFVGIVLFAAIYVLNKRVAIRNQCLKKAPSVSL